LFKIAVKIGIEANSFLNIYAHFTFVIFDVFGLTDDCPLSVEIIGVYFCVAARYLYLVLAG
jgi:hypothetical protein